jgi:hypothetical protein
MLRVWRPRPGRGGELTASSNSRRLSFWTGSPISCRRRGSTGIATTGCLRRITSSDGPSRRWRKGNIGKRGDATTGGHRGGGHGTEGCCDANHATLKPRSHDTSRIAWAKLMARVGEEFPLECPACGGDIRLIAFITEPGPIRKILTHLGEPLEPPPIAAARGPPTDWDELVQAQDDCDIFQATDRLFCP